MVLTAIASAVAAASGPEKTPDAKNPEGGGRRAFEWGRQAGRGGGGGMPAARRGHAGAVHRGVQGERGAGERVGGVPLGPAGLHHELQLRLEHPLRRGVELDGETGGHAMRHTCDALPGGRGQRECLPKGAQCR